MRTTLNDVLQAVNKGFSEMERRFQEFSREIRGELQAVEGRLERRVDGLTAAVDGFAKYQMKFDAELAANHSAHDRFEGRIEKLENRA